MSFANKYNRGSKFDIDTKGFQYLNLKQLQDPHDLDKTFTIRGFYINRKSKFGDSPVAILDDCFVNLPAHLTADVVDMLQDADIVQDIRSGKCGFQIEEYEDKNFGRHCFSVRWVDL